MAIIVAAALIIGLGINFRTHLPSEPQDIEPPPENLQPSPIADLPSSYAQAPRPKPPSVLPQPRGMDEMHHHGHMMDMAGSQDPAKDELARLLSAIGQASQRNKALAQQVAAYESAAA